jgi:type IV pilus assembly protein PilP
MWRLLLPVLVAASVLGCDAPVVVGSASVARGGPPPPPAQAAPEEAPEAETPSPADAFSNEDFIESERSRDPFRNYLREFAPVPGETTVRTDVLLPDTPVEQMRLVATITRMASPRAMVLDRAGRGHVVRRGQFIGSPVTVQTGGAGGLAVTLHWRVARIRENGMVLTRDDLSASNRPPLSQMIPLRPEGEDDIGLVSNVGEVLASPTAEREGTSGPPALPVGRSDERSRGPVVMPPPSSTGAAPSPTSGQQRVRQRVEGALLEGRRRQDATLP